MFGSLLDGTLPAPRTWETVLSERGNTKEAWDELISEGRLGMMASLRNLRNMLAAHADVGPVLDSFGDELAVRRSRLLPFRFLSAFSELRKAGLLTMRVTRALDEGMRLSMRNVDPMPGRTAVLIDVSGSMDSTLSLRSTATCWDTARALAALAVSLCDDAIVIAFSTYAKVVPMTGVSPISDCSMVPRPEGGTDMAAGMIALRDSGFDADRVIVLSDNEVNAYSWYHRDKRGHEVVQMFLDEYRARVGHDVWCHAIDLEGYGTSQFVGPKVDVIAGWSDAALRLIGMAERGFGSVVDEVEAVRLSSDGVPVR